MQFLEEAPGNDTGKWDRERAFEMADFLEKGFAREIETDFMRPLRRSSKLWRFHVKRSEDRLQHRLFSNEGEFLMYARTSVEERLVRFFLYDPRSSGEEDGAPLHDPARPAFTMDFSEAKSEWRLAQERCEHCRFYPKHLSCACRGKQQVAFIQHTRKAIGDAVSTVMDVHIPGLYSDGSRVVWCPALGRGDLSSVPKSGNHETQRLTTRRPAWNDAAESLVLDFKGHNIVSSAKNFQLALQQKPDHVICQFGKVGPTTFSLDFKYPLSVIQAFGISLTTVFLT